MKSVAPPGLFVTGTDTGVGKTYVTALIARQLTQRGLRVGVYKPIASGCHTLAGRLQCDDAVTLWEAAGRSGPLEHVCPQCFAAPLAPHLAARAAGEVVDRELLRSGIDPWRGGSDLVLVEGAGGLMSPLTDDEYVADLAKDLGYPLVIVAANRIGALNQTLQTLVAAAAFRDALPVAAVVLNQATAPADDPSVASNFGELARRIRGPALTFVAWHALACEPRIDWLAAAATMS